MGDQGARPFLGPGGRLKHAGLSFRQTVSEEIGFRPVVASDLADEAGRNTRPALLDLPNEEVLDLHDGGRVQPPGVTVLLIEGDTPNDVTPDPSLIRRKAAASPSRSTGVTSMIPWPPAAVNEPSSRTINSQSVMALSWIARVAGDVAVEVLVGQCGSELIFLDFAEDGADHRSIRTQE